MASKQQASADGEIDLVKESNDLYKELEACIRIDKHDLDGALIEQPDFYHRVSKQCALAESRRDWCKRMLDETEARADEEIRHAATVQGEKLTEPGIKNQLMLDPDVMARARERLVWSGLYGKWRALTDAFEQRSYALKSLDSLYSAGYFTDATGSGARRAATDRQYESSRDAMGAARRAAASKGASD